MGSGAFPSFLWRERDKRRSTGDYNADNTLLGPGRLISSGSFLDRVPICWESAM